MFRCFSCAPFSPSIMRLPGESENMAPVPACMVIPTSDPCSVGGVFLHLNPVLRVPLSRNNQVRRPQSLTGCVALFLLLPQQTFVLQMTFKQTVLKRKHDSNRQPSQEFFLFGKCSHFRGQKAHKRSTESWTRESQNHRALSREQGTLTVSY